MNLSDGLINALLNYLSKAEVVQLITAIQNEASKQQPKKEETKKK